MVESMKIVADENSERIARYAFEYGEYGILAEHFRTVGFATFVYLKILASSLSQSSSEKYWPHRNGQDSQGQYHETHETHENVRRSIFGGVTSYGQGLSKYPAQ